MWEAEIGSDGSRLCSRNLFRRKIDPIVNGISNMDAYNPVDKIRTDKPTVVMLSNVQMIKGVKSAIQAADIIVNRFGFTDYQLVIYGAKDRQPAYALEMERLIVENKLTGKVVLAGFGNSKEVLKDAWLFMNSSISEGLPLAIGEAALAGVPIVATEVGATALVLTDPENSEQRYGEVVPPNDPLALARAQISMLSMVGPWAKFTDQDSITEPNMKAPELPDEIQPQDIDWLTKRFYERAEDRRKLGLLSREVVLHSFHGTRYLREHEQMYWIQWHLAKMRDDPLLQADPFKFGYPEQLRYTEEEDEKSVAVVDDGTSSMQERTRSVVLAPWRARGATPDVEKTAGASTRRGMTPDADKRAGGRS
jgi:glycosyltransferase involved in cell wall biosynthesis